MACCAAAAVDVVGADDVDAAAGDDGAAAVVAGDDEVHLGPHLPGDAVLGYDYDCCVDSSTRMMAVEALKALPCYPLAWVQFSPSPHRAADPSLCVSDVFDLRALYLHVLLWWLPPHWTCVRPR